MPGHSLGLEYRLQGLVHGSAQVVVAETYDLEWNRQELGCPVGGEADEPRSHARQLAEVYDALPRAIGCQ